MCNRKGTLGFTLIEVLLAMSIFAIISLASFSIFDGVAQSEVSSKEKMLRLNELQRALLVIERDFLQIAYRSVRIEGEAPTSDFIFSDDGGFFSDEQSIAFVRSGWTNPGLLIPRSDLQAVVYRLEDKTLEKLHYNFVDAVVGEEPRVRKLIKDVIAFEVKYFYQNKWQKEIVAKQLPQAVNISIETEDFGKLSRKFLVAEQAFISQQTSKSNSRRRDDEPNPGEIKDR